MPEIENILLFVQKEQENLCGVVLIKELFNIWTYSDDLMGQLFKY